MTDLRVTYPSLFIALLIVGFEFISFIPQIFGVDSQVVTIPYRILFVFLGIALFVNKKQFPLNKMPVDFVSILIFWLIYLFKGITDLIFNYQEFHLLSGNFFLFSVLLCFFPMLPMLLSFTEKEIDEAKRITLFLTIIINLWSLVNNSSGLIEGTTVRFLGNDILNPISYGHTGVILILLAITYLSGSNLIFRLFYFGLILVGIANIGLSASRTPVMELLASLVFIFILDFRNIKAKNMALVTVLFSLAIYYFWDYLFVFNTLFDRIENTGINSDMGNVERVDLFSDAIKTAIANPVLGEHAIGSYPHNLILEAFMALGVIGGFLMIYIFFIGTTAVIRLMKNSKLNWLGLLLLTQLVSSLMSGAIWNNMIFWPLIALVLNLKHKELE